MYFTGAQAAAWLPRATVPLMLSRARLAGRTAPLPRAAAPWYLDSAAFTELAELGTWRLTPAEWATQASAWAEQAGSLVAVATQDWVCTPPALAATGLTVAEHQARTLASYLALVELAPALPWVPTLQGWLAGDYLHHADAYAAAGIDLPSQPLVGLGSVAVRQHTPEAARVARAVATLGCRLHAYGVKDTGLRSWGWALASADSMAWSTTARREATKVCTASHADCRNCQVWAEQWGTRMAALVGGPEPDHHQLVLGSGSLLEPVL